MPIEINARIGGAETYSNVKAAWGVDLARAALRISLGLPPRLPARLLLAAKAQLPSVDEASAPAEGPTSVCSAVPGAAAVNYCGHSIAVASDRRSSGACVAPETLSILPPPPPPPLDSSLSACGCGCPDGCLCCTDSKCGCYWDFLKRRAGENGDGRQYSLDVDSAPGSSVCGASEPAAATPLECVCIAKALSHHTPALTTPTQDSAIVASLPTVSTASEVLVFPGVSTAASSRRSSFDVTDSHSIGTPQPKADCHVAHCIWPESQMDVGVKADPSLRFAHQIITLRPLSYVHSVNFVPQAWTGMATVERIEVRLEGLNILCCSHVAANLKIGGARGSESPWIRRL